MGIYDRDYYRQQRPRFSFPAPSTVVGIIILINVAVYVIDGLFAPQTLHGRWLSDQMAVHVGTLSRPWLWWQMLTYGFAHSPLGFEHILFNMLALWFLDRAVERAYGPKEFLRLYLVMVVFAALVWCVVNNLTGVPPQVGAYGASGAIAGVVILFALRFPHTTILLFFVLPMPAWVLGVMVVVFDILGAMKRAGPDNVAYTMHLAGAAFAFVYYRRGWNLSSISLKKLRPRPKLRVHDPETEDGELSEEVDRILEKIHSNGEDSLTSRERRTLETASRKYKQRRE